MILDSVNGLPITRPTNYSQSEANNGLVSIARALIMFTIQHLTARFIFSADELSNESSVQQFCKGSSSAVILKMAKQENESIRSASEEISREFKTLVDSRDLDSLKQSQNLMYVYTRSSIVCLCVLYISTSLFCVKQLVSYCCFPPI